MSTFAGLLIAECLLLADSCRLVDSNLLIFSLAKECPDGAGKRNGYVHSSGTWHRYGIEIKTSAGLPGPTRRQDGTLMTSCTGTNTAPVTGAYRLITQEHKTVAPVPRLSPAHIKKGGGPKTPAWGRAW